MTVLVQTSEPVAQYCNPTIRGLGLLDKDPRLRLWISMIHTMPKDVDTLWKVEPGAHTYMSDTVDYSMIHTRPKDVDTLWKVEPGAHTCL